MVVTFYHTLLHNCKNAVIAAYIERMYNIEWFIWGEKNYVVRGWKDYSTWQSDTVSGRFSALPYFCAGKANSVHHALQDTYHLTIIMFLDIGITLGFKTVQKQKSRITVRAGQNRQLKLTYWRSVFTLIDLFIQFGLFLQRIMECL